MSDDKLPHDPDKLANPLGAPQSPLPPDGLDVMSCEQAVRQLERMIEDCELKEIERTLLFSHIRACAHCKAELQRRRRLELRLKETFAPIDTRVDFNERLMDALPRTEFKREPIATPLDPPSSEDAPRATSRTARLERVSARALANLPPLASRRVQAVIGIAALVLIGAGLYLRFGPAASRGPDMPPSIAHVNGKALIQLGKAGANPETVSNERVLRPKEIVTVAADGSDATVKLTFEGQELARITLEPGAELSAGNRHSYTLVGSAHFVVNPERPQEADEFFEVHLGANVDDIVRVRGTTFDIKDAGGVATVVSVLSGHVEVERRAVSEKFPNAVELITGQRVTLGNGGFIGGVVAMQDRQAPLPPVVPPPNPNGNPGAIRNAIVNPPAIPIPNGRPAVNQFDWETSIGPLLTRDLPLAEAIDAVAAHTGKPKVLLDLAQAARGPLISPDSKLSFSLHRPMSVRSALAWMARDVSARLEIGADGRAGLRLAGPDELPGKPDSGAMSQNVLKLLEAPLRPGRASNVRVMLPEALDEIAAAAGITIVSDGGSTIPVAYGGGDGGDSGRPATAARRLETVLAGAHLCAVWYDDALYVAPADKVEALTAIERRKFVAAFIGLPEQTEFARALLAVMESQNALPALLPLTAGMPPSAAAPGYSDVDRALAGKPAYALIGIARTENGACLRYRAGIAGETWVVALLSQLERGNTAPHGAAGLTQNAPNGAVKDLQTLIAAAPMPVDIRIKNSAFGHQAFAVKNMRLGRALEWGAWLQDLGVRSGAGANGLVVDSLESCYGAPALQVVSLKSPLAKAPELSVELPAYMAKLLPELYPTFFGGVEFKTLLGRIAFIGDRRQLQLANDAVNALDQDLDLDAGGGERKKFELSGWKPVWRRAIETNLALPFNDNAGLGVVSGTFAGLLRQSNFGIQFNHTVVVDLKGMRDHFGDGINNLDIAQITVGQFIDRLVKAAEMKAVLEGDVVWIKP